MWKGEGNERMGWTVVFQPQIPWAWGTEPRGGLDGPLRSRKWGGLAGVLQENGAGENCCWCWCCEESRQQHSWEGRRRQTPLPEDTAGVFHVSTVPEALAVITVSIQAVQELISLKRRVRVYTRSGCGHKCRSATCVLVSKDYHTRKHLFWKDFKISGLGRHIDLLPTYANH